MKMNHLKKVIVGFGLAALVASSSISAAIDTAPMYPTSSSVEGRTEDRIEPQVVPAAAVAVVGVQLVRAAAAAGVVTVVSEAVKNFSEAYKNFSKGKDQPDIQTILPETALD